MQVGAILVTAAGAALLTHGAYPLWSFFAGGVAVYMGTIVLEGVSMSLTSKVRLGLSCLLRVRWVIRGGAEQAAECSITGFFPLHHCLSFSKRSPRCCR